MTCKDCIHYDVCNMYDGPYISVHFDHTCKYFTDKQLVAFLPCKVGEEVYVMNGGNIPLILTKRTVYSSAQIAKKNLCLLAEVLKRMNMNIVHIAAAKWTR